MNDPACCNQSNDPNCRSATFIIKNMKIIETITNVDFDNWLLERKEYYAGILEQSMGARESSRNRVVVPASRAI
jgi:hypothetical protein